MNTIDTVQNKKVLKEGRKKKEERRKKKERRKKEERRKKMSGGLLID